jgi:hypothetical protein
MGADEHLDATPIGGATARRFFDSTICGVHLPVVPSASWRGVNC